MSAYIPNAGPTIYALLFVFLFLQGQLLAKAYAAWQMHTSCPIMLSFFPHHQTSAITVAARMDEPALSTDLLIVTLPT